MDNVTVPDRRILITAYLSTGLPQDRPRDLDLQILDHPYNIMGGKRKRSDLSDDGGCLRKLWRGGLGRMPPRLPSLECVVIGRYVFMKDSAQWRALSLSNATDAGRQQLAQRGVDMKSPHRGNLRNF